MHQKKEDAMNATKATHFPGFIHSQRFNGLTLAVSFSYMFRHAVWPVTDYV
jgi:hypothetical protein